DSGEPSCDGGLAGTRPRNSPAAEPGAPSTIAGICWLMTSSSRCEGRQGGMVAEADLRLEQIAELGAVRHRIDRGHVRAPLDDVDADLVVGRRARHHGRLDTELL